MEGPRLNVALEHRPALHICSFNFELDTETRCTVKVQKSRIELLLHETGSSINFELKDEYSIDLTALNEWNTLEWMENGSTQGCVSTGLMRSGTIRLKLSSQPEDETPKRNVEVLPGNIRYELQCKECRLTLTREGWESKRVLPLPSENWRSLQDMWFCHKPPTDQAQRNGSFDSSRDETTGLPHGTSTDSDHRSQLLTRDLLPKIEDLYYSNTKLLLHSLAIAPESMAGSDCRSIICRGCNNIVGQRDSEESIYFYRMNVDLKDPSSSRIINPRTPLNLIAKLVREQIAHGCAHCRLILSSESSGDTLLIWMLDSDVLVFWDQFGVMRSEELEKPVAFQQCHQVLFQSTKRYAPIVQAWSSELTVCSESILQSTVETLRDHLVRSKPWFLMNGNDDSFDPDFEVGYIPAL